MHINDIRTLVAAKIADAEDTKTVILEVKPEAANGKSDGRRVRYVRAETTATVLTEVLDLLDELEVDY